MTQEELAEAIGVSRVWYSMLENGSAVRTSRRMLEALAGALMLDASERATLFSLAIPELRQTLLMAVEARCWTPHSISRIVNALALKRTAI